MLSEQSGSLDFEHRYSGSTRNVIMNVLLGRAEAGATLSPQLDREPAEIRSKIRILLESRELPSHPLSAHPRVPEPVRNAVQRAVLDLARTPEGAELVKQVRMPSPTATDYERDYKAFEGVPVMQLSDWGN